MKRRPTYYQTEKEREAWKRTPDEVRGMSAILPEVNKSLGIDKWMARMAVLRLWPQVVDSPWDKQSESVAIKPDGREKEVLTVRVAHAAAASDLRFSLETYRQRLNGYQAQTGLIVDRIDVKVR